MRALVMRARQFHLAGYDDGCKSSGPRCDSRSSVRRIAGHSSIVGVASSGVALTIGVSLRKLSSTARETGSASTSVLPAPDTVAGEATVFARGALTTSIQWRFR